jgi:hypothetical protein
MDPERGAPGWFPAEDAGTAACSTLNDRSVHCDIRCMVHDRLVQPRQIYASTLTRRDRRWTGRRGHGPLARVVALAGALAAAAWVVASFSGVA